MEPLIVGDFDNPIYLTPEDLANLSSDEYAQYIKNRGVRIEYRDESIQEEEF